MHSSVLLGAPPTVLPARDAQVDHNVERELLNHRKLSGHPNIVQFKEASGAGLAHLGVGVRVGLLGLSTRQQMRFQPCTRY